MSHLKLLLALALTGTLAGCGDSASLPESASVGPNPTIPAPNSSLIPTVDIAPAEPWQQGAKPVPAAAFRVEAFARGLDHPRHLLLLPNGDVLVAESNAPQRPDDGKGIKGMIYRQVQKRAGAGVPSPNRIMLLRDADGDGVAETRHIFLKDQNAPFGMVLVGDKLYVANTDAVMRFTYHEGDTEITGEGEKVTDLPAGTLNHHWTKGLTASPDGTKLYASVGSNSNVGENGLDKEQDRALIYEIDVASGAKRVFASGLRNPVDLAFEPQTGALWAVVNERDELGSDLVPDYLTSVKDGAFYGWPFSYWGQHVDKRVKPQNPEKVKAAIMPDYALGNHVAPLGIAFAKGDSLPEQFRNGAFVGEHGSWNRKPPSGYKVVFVPFKDGRPQGTPIDVLTGFVNANGRANGRPVGVAIDRTGALLVADDVGNSIWRVAPAGTTVGSGQ